MSRQGLEPVRNIRPRTGPEAKIQAALINFFKTRDWGVKETHGNLYQSGFPDLYIYHYRYGTRWVEVKVPEKYKFTNAQLESFPEMSAKGVGIWILTAATEDQYKKLFKPANWHFFFPSIKINSRLGI